MKVSTLLYGHLLQSGTKTAKIASYLAENIFNAGYESLLKMNPIMNIIIGAAVVSLCIEASGILRYSRETLQ